MKIFVQGRKYGFNVFYPLPTPAEFYDFAKDNQSINAQNQAFFYGKSLYSIAFAKAGRIYSKYVLGYDVQRSNLGNVSFSIYLPDDQVLAGDKIIEVLDTLAEKYFKEYAPDYYIKDTQENWSAIIESVGKYDSLIKPRERYDIEHLEMGNQDAAYIYYDSAGQLRAYFDDPYQSVYSAYSQVYFVDKSLKGKDENPLKAFKHGADSDLTGKIDLNNKRYRLVLRDEAGAKVNRISGGQSLPVSSNGHFYKNDELRIEWTKPFCVSAEQRGSIESLEKYLEIDESNRTVSIKPVKLSPITKDVQPQFILRTDPVIMDQLTCKNGRGEEIPFVDGKLHFEGESVKQSWTISASKAPCISARVTFIPEEVSSVYIIKVTEKKTIYFNGFNKSTNEPIPSIEISYSNDSHRKARKYVGSIEFTNEELDITYSLDFHADGFFPGGPLEIVPRKADETIRVDLVPKSFIKTPDNGGDNDNQLGHSSDEGSWLKKNLLLVILSVLLLLSVGLNVFLLISRPAQKETENVTEKVEGVKTKKEKSDSPDGNIRQDESAATPPQTGNSSEVEESTTPKPSAPEASAPNPEKETEVSTEPEQTNKSEGKTDEGKDNKQKNSRGHKKNK